MPLFSTTCGVISLALVLELEGITSTSNRLLPKSPPFQTFLVIRINSQMSPSLRTLTKYCI